MKGKKKCPKCSSMVNARGLSMHMKHCKGTLLDVVNEPFGSPTPVTGQEHIEDLTHEFNGLAEKLLKEQEKNQSLLLVARLLVQILLSH
jgi:hypothetical protein